MLTIPKLSERTGVNYRTLYRWLKAGLFLADKTVDNPKEDRRFFSENTVKEIRFIKQLKDVGLSTQRIKNIASYLASEHGLNPFSKLDKFTLVKKGGGDFELLLSDNDYTIDLKSAGKLTLLKIDLS